jgi:fibronectin-binding autotransporter adhesin
LGMLVLGGASTYSGSTMVTAGTLELLSGNFVTSFTAENGGALLFSGTSINLGSGFVQALTGGNALYQNAMISGGFLRGPGSHTFLAGSTNSLNGTTIVNGAVVQQSGTTSFTDVTSGGQISDNSNAILTWRGVNNASSGSITVNNSAILNVSEWYNDGFITINNGGVLNNSVTHLASGGGSQILINSGGTLNANSDAQGETLDLQGSLLVNNGTVTGTTNVEYGATVSGSGSFGPINVMQAGAVVAAASAVPAPTSLTVTSGSISGSGNLSVSATVTDATLATPNLTDTLTLSGNLSGPGPITKIGPGTLVLSGTNTFGAGTNVEAGTVLVTGNYALPDGSNLSVGSGIMAFAAAVVPAAVAAPTSPVPEPGTLVLLLLGASGAAVYRSLRSRRKK